MSDIKNLVEESFSEILEAINESDDHTVLTRGKPQPGMPKHYNDRVTQMFDQRHSTKGTMAKLKKGMSDHEKKHMKGAYFDDTHIVHRNSSKTMSNVLDHKKDKPKTYGEVRKEIQAHIAKHHPEK